MNKKEQSTDDLLHALNDSRTCFKKVTWNDHDLEWCSMKKVQKKHITERKETYYISTFGSYFQAVSKISLK